MLLAVRQAFDQGRDGRSLVAAGLVVAKEAEIHEDRLYEGWGNARAGAWVRLDARKNHVQGVIVRCIVAVAAMERFIDNVQQNQNEGEDDAERVGDISP